MSTLSTFCMNLLIYRLGSGSRPRMLCGRPGIPYISAARGACYVTAGFGAVSPRGIGVWYTPCALAPPVRSAGAHSRPLVLEDDSVFAALLLDLLTEERYPTTSAPTGRLGLAAWRRRRPALVILELPPLTPAAQWEFLAPIGQDAMTAEACVIVCTI